MSLIAPKRLWKNHASRFNQLNPNEPVPTKVKFYK